MSRQIHLSELAADELLLDRLGAGEDAGREAAAALLAAVARHAETPLRPPRGPRSFASRRALTVLTVLVVGASGAGVAAAMTRSDSWVPRHNPHVAVSRGAAPQAPAPHPTESLSWQSVPSTPDVDGHAAAVVGGRPAVAAEPPAMLPPLVVAGRPGEEAALGNTSGADPGLVSAGRTARTAGVTTPALVQSGPDHGTPVRRGPGLDRSGEQGTLEPSAPDATMTLMSAAVASPEAAPVDAPGLARRAAQPGDPAPAVGRAHSQGPTAESAGETSHVPATTPPASPSDEPGSIPRPTEAPAPPVPVLPTTSSARAEHPVPARVPVRRVPVQPLPARPVTAPGPMAEEYLPQHPAPAADPAPVKVNPAPASTPELLQATARPTSEPRAWAPDQRPGALIPLP